MEIVKESERRTLRPTPSLEVHEYDMHDPSLGGGIAVLKGRYPENGFVFNEETKELAYILEGNGALITPDKETLVSKGDMILLYEKERYAWNGHMTLFLSNSPRFNPEQHKTIFPSK